MALGKAVKFDLTSGVVNGLFEQVVFGFLLGWQFCHTEQSKGALSCLYPSRGRNFQPTGALLFQP